MVKNVSPFRFGQIVDSFSFINREMEFKLLENNLFSGNHVIIVSPRRYGKSSLIQQFILDKKNEPDVIHCLIDMFSVHNEADFYEILASEVIKSTSGKIEEWIQIAKNVFKNLIPRISFGTDPFSDFTISFDVKEIKKHKTEILDLASEIAKKKQKRIIIYLDEFQNIGSFPNSFEIQKDLRSVWQRHKQVSYCLFGSKRHMMLEFFNKTDAPFYRFGSLLVLDRIEQHHWEKYIASAFEKTNKYIKEKLVIRITQLMKNHPHYVQQLAHFTWSFSGRNVTEDVIEYALDFMLSSNSPLFIKIVEDLSTTQINLLKAIIKGASHLTSQEIMAEYNLGTPHNVFKNKIMLEKKDVIDITSGYIFFIDPLFEIWFKRNVKI